MTRPPLQINIIGTKLASSEKESYSFSEDLLVGAGGRNLSNIQIAGNPRRDPYFGQCWQAEKRTRTLLVKEMLEGTSGPNTFSQGYVHVRFEWKSHVRISGLCFSFKHGVRPFGTQLPKHPSTV